MVLLFSKVIGVFSWGMASVLGNGGGNPLTITSLALLVHTFRALAVKTQWKQSAGAAAVVLVNRWRWPRGHTACCGAGHEA
ncbi:hypothetical protein KCP71_13475 [Salmonella enterica subsp. enterica]|nr:hypothetical protein KCP71_13475 [Salmonella enterica subsp. enterica]